jgi:NAD(P)H dehydrogenase (quinone)
LQGFTVHLLPIAGDDAGLYDRHGYETALRTQIQHGIVDYGGARRGATPFLHESERKDTDATSRALDAVVAEISGAILGSKAAQKA